MAHAQVVVAPPQYSLNGSAETFVIRDSKFGFVPRISHALAAQLQAQCAGRADDQIISSLELFPQRFGSNSAAAIAALEGCRNIRLGENGGVSAAGWRLLEIAGDLPTVWSRTRALVYPRSQHTFDYDLTFWDLDAPRYRESIFTWGPLHATVGEGCTLLTIVRRATSTPSLATRVRGEFEAAGEAAWLDLVLNNRQCTAGPEKIVKDATFEIYNDFARKDRFEDVFRRLADVSEIRHLYDSGYFGEGGWRAAQLNRYYDLYRRAGLVPSEVDFAFFIDHAVDAPPITPVVDRTIEAARAQGILPRARAEKPDPLANARFRRLFAREFAIHVLQPDRAATLAAGQGSFNDRSRFRRGRDAIYYVDLLWDEMPENERTDWIDHARIKASDVGLAPDRAYYPCSVTPRADGCIDTFSVAALLKGG